MKSALVTGASRGIGRATALALAGRGVALALFGRASERLTQTAAEARAAGSPRVEEFHADLADLDTVEREGRRVEQSFGALDAVIHNAGVVRRARVEELEIALFEEQIRVNLTAPFVLTRTLLPAMRRAGSGRILFVGSISSTLGTPALSAYCASKWGVVGLMKSLAEELSDSGLMTAAVLPGSVDTDMLVGSGFQPRMTAEDVAKTLLWLALDAPLAHNGATFEMFGV